MVSGKRAKSQRRQKSSRVQNAAATSSRSWRRLILMLGVCVIALTIACFWPGTPDEEVALTQQTSALGWGSIVAHATNPPFSETQIGTVVDVPSTTQIDAFVYRFTLAGVLQLVFAGIAGALVSVLMSWIPRRLWRWAVNAVVAACCTWIFFATLVKHTPMTIGPSGETAAASPWVIWQLQAINNLSSIAIGLVIGAVTAALLPALQVRRNRAAEA